MNITHKTVRTYEDESGKRPLEEWLKGLDDQIGKARINARIARLAVGALGDYGSVGKGVLELCVDVGPGYRIYFVIKGTQLIILLCGGDKGTQKKDIRRAHAYAATIK